MAEEIKNTVEATKEIDIQKVEEAIMDEPEVFGTSKTAKIVFGVVTGITAGYALFKGFRYLRKKVNSTSYPDMNDISEEDVEEADFTEVEEG